MARINRTQEKCRLFSALVEDDFKELREAMDGGRDHTW